MSAEDQDWLEEQLGTSDGKWCTKNPLACLSMDKTYPFVQKCALLNSP